MVESLYDYLASVFAPNHKGMPHPAGDEDFLRKQVLTSRNVPGGWLTDAALDRVEALTAYGAQRGLTLLEVAVGGLAALLLEPSLASLIGSYGSRLRFQGPDVLVVLVIVFTATSLGWLGAWLASGHHLRQTRPTDL